MTRHSSATARIQSRFERWELDHLRALAAEQAERIEELERRCYRAEDLADSWREEALQMHRDAANEVGGVPGLTIDGRLVVVQAEARAS